MNNNPIRIFEEKYYKKKFKHPSYSNESSSIINEFELKSENRCDKFLKEIGDRFIPEKMYATRFNPRWALELIIGNIDYIPKFSFVLEYEELHEKHINAPEFNIFDGCRDPLLFYLDSFENPKLTAIGYGRLSMEGIPFNDAYHVNIKLNYRFKTLSFPAQILFMIFIVNDFIVTNNRLSLQLFSPFNHTYNPSSKGFRYNLTYCVNAILARKFVYDLYDARRLFYSDLVDNFTELSFKASVNDPYYRKYIKELERTGKGLL